MPSDQVLSSLTSASSLASTDILYVMQSPSGTPLDRKATCTVLASGLQSLFTGLTVTNTTPSVVITDSTASAKSLTINVGSNIADFKESASSAGTLLTLDLTNKRVGIGTSAPGSPTHVKQASAGQSPFLFVEQTSTGSAGVLIGKSGRSYSVAVDAADSSAFKISTAASSTGAAPGTGDLLRIETNGNMSLGSTTPVAIFGKTFQCGDGTTNASFSLLGSSASGYFATSGTGFLCYARGGATMQFGANDVEKMRLDTSGNACIGVTAPGTSATTNLVLGGGSTTPVLGAATADIVSLAGIDNGAGNRELQVQPETGGIWAFGSDVVRRVPSATRNVDDRIKTVTTTDATVTTVDTIAITASSTYIITSTIVARRTGGVSGTADDGATYVRRSSYTTKAGVVTLLGTVQTVGTDAEDQAAWDVTHTISSTNVLVRVTGAAANNISWQAHVVVERISS